MRAWRPAIAGSILFFVKVIDWLTDLAVGILSDRTKTRWGRRRPWILAGALLITVACALMFQVAVLFPRDEIIMSAALTLVFYTGFSHGDHSPACDAC